MSMSTQLDLLWSSSSFSPTVTRDWPGSANLLIRTLVNAAMSDCDKEDGSKISVAFNKDQKPSNFMTGEVRVTLSRRAAKCHEIKKHNLPLPHGQKVSSKL